MFYKYGKHTHNFFAPFIFTLFEFLHFMNTFNNTICWIEMKQVIIANLEISMVLSFLGSFLSVTSRL